MRPAWLSRRAIGLHLTALVVVPGCLALGWWQLQRALSGNGLSWAYTVEWPAFALIASVGTVAISADDIRAARLRQHDLPVPDDPDLGRPTH